MSKHSDFPTLSALTAVIADVKADVRNGCGHDGYMEVRLQVVPGEGWHIHTGDPQYDTDHRGHWGCGEVSRRSNCREVAKGMLEEGREDAVCC